jgi:hypothetical protein
MPATWAHCLRRFTLLLLLRKAICGARCKYGDAACPEARNLTTLARWIAKQRPNAVHVRDIQRNIRLPGLVTADAIHDDYLLSNGESERRRWAGQRRTCLAFMTRRSSVGRTTAA